MKKAGILMAASLLTTSTATMAQADSEGREDAREEKRICKSERITGSLTRVRRICMTQLEWDRLAEGSRRSVDEVVRDGNQKLAVQHGGG